MPALRERIARWVSNRKFRGLLMVVEIAAILLFVLILITPIQDYALTEFKAYMAHPSPETLEAFERKSDGEWRVHLIVAAPFAGVALMLGRFVFRKRSA